MTATNTDKPKWLTAVLDALQAIKLAAIQSAPKLLTSWLYVPIGIFTMLAVCFGVSVAFRAAGVSFPASVACLILLFFALLLSEAVLGGHKTKAIVAVIDVPAGWSLRWINILFTPSFIMLPLSPSVGILEVVKIIAVFLIGFVVMMALAAYLTRSLQLLLGTSKRALTERAEEIGNETDEIPLADTPPRTDSTPGSRTISAAPSSLSLDTIAPPPPSRNFLPASGSVPPSGTTTPTSALPPQIPLPLPRSHIWASLIRSNLDVAIYTTLFLTGLPIYYTTSYAMPLHLPLIVLLYLAASSIPAPWRQYLHPVLVSSLLSVLLIWSLAAIRGDTLPSTLHSFRTGANYTYLWLHPGTSARLPGAGDIFSTVLDAGIISLALPMYQYRRELRQHAAAIVLPNVAMSVGCLFCYPKLCYAVGIGAGRSLAFASRSLTLALAIPATENLGGDVNAVAALAIMSGIVGVLVGQRMLAWFGIPEDDYVTRGVTLGANSSAIATALLLRTDPRAAALSSLSMSLFGTITVLFTSIPPVADVIKSLVT
ncbi:hypothetical protein CPLU01_08352 [Colletotrichum plurivorum]|uniref:LrgB-like family protein n=1 Tax=Colletotrichum plurivorum TaxID=2175906 RepID=A0A8H6KCR4_9PEZI|nr:hypothetical protein CPLU01_08352 [Colletotrichum plurivorum]